MSKSASRREIVAHAERMADEHIPAWRHMAVVSKKMEHWAQEPTGDEMNELVDAYGAMHTEKQIREQGLIDSASQNPREMQPRSVSNEPAQVSSTNHALDFERCRNHLVHYARTTREKRS